MALPGVGRLFLPIVQQFCSFLSAHGLWHLPGEVARSPGHADPGGSLPGVQRTSHGCTKPAAPRQRAAGVWHPPAASNTLAQMVMEKGTVRPSSDTPRDRTLLVPTLNQPAAGCCCSAFSPSCPAGLPWRASLHSRCAHYFPLFCQLLAERWLVPLSIT